MRRAGGGGCSGSTACTRTRPRTSRSSRAGRGSCGGSRLPRGAETMAGRAPAFRKFTKLDLAFLLILVGVGGRLLLLRVANVETVLAVSMLAGAFLGWRYALLVTLAVMGVSDAVIYALGYGGGGRLVSILRITACTWCR